MTANIKSYSLKLTENQRKKLTDIINDGTWDITEAPHAYWKAKKNSATLVAYNSGKFVVQGKGTQEFIEFILEPEITGILPDLHQAAAGSDKVQDDSLPLPHAGIDESGKGDFFGPLVIAAVFVDQSMEHALLKAGVKDSKVIKNEKKIIEIASKIRNIVKGKFAVVAIGPEAYNRLYDNIKNLNKLLAWGHARVLENLLQKAPECNVALSDKFGNASLIENALLENGKKITLHQKTKGESDIAVAAASIIARDEFVRRLKQLAEPLGFELPKGASKKVEEHAREAVLTYGSEILAKIAKLHFKTTAKVMNTINPE
jgi:ribonuclease HIII